MSVVIPFGRLKGVALEDAPDEGIAWVLGKVEAKLADDPNKPYADKDREWCEAARRELVRRGHAPSEVAGVSAPAASTALATVVPTELVTGSFTDPHEIVAALRIAQSKALLVAPSPDCGSLPEGCEVQLSAVLVDARKETYSVPGGRALNKAPLQRIAWALGIDWDEEKSRQLDDGRDPRYVHYRAVGRIRNYDGSWRTIKGEKRMDLRDGSPMIVAIQEREAEKKRTATKENPYKGDGGLTQIRELRQSILEHAETKAHLRAIRSLGLRPSYSEAELRLPLVCGKLAFTGRSPDPEVAKEYRAAIAASFLGPRGAQSTLYGPEAPPDSEPKLPAPPVGSVPADDEAIDVGGDEVKSEPAAAKQPAKPTKKPEQQSFDDVGDEPDYGASKKY